MRGLGVCAWARVLAAPHHYWPGLLGCACAFACVLRLYPTTSDWGVHCGCSCLGSGSGCAPPLVARVLGSVCVCVCTPLILRHSLRGGAVCVFVFGFRFQCAPANTNPATDTTEHRNSTTLTTRTQDATNQRRGEKTGYTNNIRLCNHRQQHEGTHTNQADHEAARTTAHQPHRSCSRDLTINRPHASRPTLNQPGVHGSKRERLRTGWPHRDAPHLPIRIPTDTTEHHNPIITQPTNFF